MNKIVNFLLENWVPLTTLFGTVWLYFANRKKDKIELRSQTASALESMQTSYDKWVNDSNYRFEQLKAELVLLQEREREGLVIRAKLETELGALKKKADQDAEKIEHLTKQVAVYEAKIKEYDNQVKILKAALDESKTH